MSFISNSDIYFGIKNNRKIYHLTEEEKEFNRGITESILQYLLERDSEPDGTLFFLLKIHLSFHSEDYLRILLDDLIKAKLVEKRDALELSVLSAELLEINGKEDYGKYFITNKGKLQLKRGKFTKKKVKIELSEEEKKKRRDERRATVRHRWLVISIIVAVLGVIQQVLYHILDIDLLHYIKQFFRELLL